MYIFTTVFTDRLKFLNSKKDLRYSISTLSIDHAGSSDYVKISGRLSGGDSCEQLLILMEIESSYGDVWHAKIKANRVSASSLFEGRQYVGTKNNGARWKMKEVKYECND